MKTKNLLTTMALTLTLLLAGKVGWGQIIINSSGVPLTEDFNTLANSGTSSVLPTGWTFFESGTNANTTYTASDGTSTSGDTYSFGTTSSTDRAFGTLLSSSLNSIIGVSYTNNTGKTITQLTITFTGEQWRLGATGRTDRLDFQYSLDATSINTGTWTDVNELDFNAPNSTGTVGKLDGNAASNRTTLNYSINGLSILNGTTFWIRFTDFNASGADDGLAIDDWTLTPFVDTQSPQLTFNPADAATNVEPNVKPTITFDEAVRNIDDSEITDANVASLITLKETDGSGADVPFTATISADKKVITITPSANLDFNQAYYLAIAPVEDVSDNATSAQSITFTTRVASTDATVSSVVYTVDNVAETITNVPSSENLATFKSNITPAAAATFEVYEGDGTTVATDLQTGYKLICTAEDGTTKKTYTITLNTAASNDATVSSTVYTVDNVAETITNVPWNETLTTFKTNITPAAGATFEVYEADGSTVATDLQSEYKLICTAEDGVTKKTYTISLNPYIEVTFPNGNETFYAGDNMNITWNSANMNAETIKFEAYIRFGLSSTWDWIEVIPAIPNTGSLSFTIPSDAKYGNQYKIRLTGNTSGVSDESDAPFTVIATPSIYDIQSHNTAGASDWSGDKVRFSGIVTAQYSTTTRFFVQDSAKGWNGIYVFNSPVSPAIGDSVVVEGTVTEYNGLTEISPTTSTTVVASGKPLPTPIDLTTLAVNDEQYESVLVKVTGAICLSGSSGNFTVNDGSGNLVVYKSLFSGLTLNINRKYDITGVVGWYSPNYQLYPRNAADIYLYNNVATLSDLQVDGATVTGFDPATLTYNVELPYGTTTVPTVTYTLTDAKASAVKNDAAALPGATTVAVTAEDGLVSQTYTINFTIAAPNTEANILTYTVAGVNATIDNVNHTITATVPYSTDITNLVATFTLSDGATAKVGGVDQISGTTANDFTNPVVYTVTAQDGTTTQDWTVTITKAAEPNHEANITAYSINGVDGIINDGAHTISVTLPYGTDVTALVATFTLSTNATAKVGGVDQVSGTTANDFTNPVTYTVTAEDGIITQDWTVTVIVTPASTAKDIVSFTLGGELSSVIDANAATVTIVMPYGTDVTNLTPVISISEFATINPASGVAQDFTNPVVYTVTAQDGSTKVWTVTVTVAKNTETDIIAYSINGEGGSIDNVNHTVDVTLPHGTDVTSLIAEFTLSGGATAKVGTVDQVSGVTPNDFTNPVVYTITAEDGTTTQDWTVTVTVAEPPMVTLVGWTFPNNPDDAIADEGIAENLTRTLTCTASGTVAYNVTGVTTYAATNTGWDNGVDTKYWMVEFTTLGYENTKVYSAQRSSSTGPRDFKLQYQVNNSGNWIDVPGATNIVVASDFVSGVVNVVPLPDECNNKNLVSLRWVVTSTVAVNGGTVASTGTNRIDNIYVGGNLIVLSSNATVSSLVYTVNNVAGTITNVPQTETLENFKANITPAEGATFEVYQADGTTVATDLQTGYKLICTAEDGVTKKTYTITLNTTLSSEKAILSYSINGVTGTIDAGAHTVTLTLPYGTDRSNLVATFTLSAAATAKVGATAQVSGVTANDFTNPVTYTITAEDGSTQDWVVTVNLTAPSSEKGITSFTIAGQISSDIDNVAGTVTVVMPYGTNLTNLVPTITVSQYATISPASGVAQDFTNPVVYTVTAQDGSTRAWTVTVTTTSMTLTKIYNIQHTTDPTGDSPLKGQQVLTKGVVTAVKTGTSSFNFWLQDSAKAWNGVYVYGVNNSLGSVAQGDSVEVVGTVDEYNNLTEIKSVTYLKVLNSGNAMPAPVEVAVLDAKSEAYEGVLVKLVNVECTVVDAGYGEFTVSDGTNTINIDDFLYKYTPVQGSRYNITGVVDYSFNAFKLIPRSAGDIESAETKYTVTFTVKRADGTTVVPDATINVTGQGNITTDANGQATMQLPDGSYTYTVIKTGFNTFSGNFTVNGANLSVPVTLIMTGIPTSPISKLNVYPNPFTNAIYFTGSEVSRITITSVIGQMVMDRQVENTESIDLSSLERGIYLVRFYNSNGESVLRKLVKE